MEVELLLWRRPNAPSVTLLGGVRFLRLAEFVRYNRAAIGGPSKRQPMIPLPKLSYKPPRLMYKNKIGEKLIHRLQSILPPWVWWTIYSRGGGGGDKLKALILSNTITTITEGTKHRDWSNCFNGYKNAHRLLD